MGRLLKPNKEHKDISICKVELLYTLTPNFFIPCFGKGKCYTKYLLDCLPLLCCLLNGYELSYFRLNPRLTNHKEICLLIVL